MLLAFLSPQRFFLCLAIIFGFLYLFITPPFRVHDEPYHFVRIYEFAEGGLLAPEVEIPRSILNFIDEFRSKKNYKLSTENTDGYFDLLSFWIMGNLNAGQSVNIKATRASYYSPFAYITAIPIMKIGIWLNWSPLILLYVIRFTLFITGTAMIYTAIRITPIFKWQMTLVGLFPNSVYIRSAVNADQITIGYAFLIFAITLYLLMNKKSVGKKEAGALSLLSTALCLAKTVYMPLILIFFILPRQRFASMRTQTKLSLIIVFLPLLIGSAWIYTAAPYINPSPVVKHKGEARYIHYNDNRRKKDNNNKQKIDFLIERPLLAILMPIRTAIHDMRVWLPHLSGFVGRTVESLVPFFVLISLLPFLIPTGRPPDNFVMGRKQRAVIFVIFLAAYYLICLSLYITWSKVGALTANGVQGRYMLPILPLLWAVFLPYRDNYGKYSAFALPLAQILIILALIITINEQLNFHYFPKPPVETTGQSIVFPQ